MGIQEEKAQVSAEVKKSIVEGEIIIRFTSGLPKHVIQAERAQAIREGKIYGEITSDVPQEVTDAERALVAAEERLADVLAHGSEEEQIHAHATLRKAKEERADAVMNAMIALGSNSEAAGDEGELTEESCSCMSQAEIKRCIVCEEVATNHHPAPLGCYWACGEHNSALGHDTDQEETLDENEETESERLPFRCVITEQWDPPFCIHPKNYFDGCMEEGKCKLGYW